MDESLNVPPAAASFVDTMARAQLIPTPQKQEEERSDHFCRSTTSLYVCLSAASTPYCIAGTRYALVPLNMLDRRTLFAFTAMKELQSPAALFLPKAFYM